jgi:hypothetical protein
LIGSDLAQTKHRRYLRLEVSGAQGTIESRQAALANNALEVAEKLPTPPRIEGAVFKLFKDCVLALLLLVAHDGLTGVIGSKPLD